MRYRLDELAKLSAELGLVTRRVDVDRLGIAIDDGCVLAFCNLKDEPDTLLGFMEPPGIRTTGAVLDGRSHVRRVRRTGDPDRARNRRSRDHQRVFGRPTCDRSLAHRHQALDLRYMQPGDEIRVLRVPPGTSGATDPIMPGSG